MRNPLVASLLALGIAALFAGCDGPAPASPPTQAEAPKQEGQQVTPSTDAVTLNGALLPQEKAEEQAPEPETLWGMECNSAHKMVLSISGLKDGEVEYEDNTWKVHHNGKVVWTNAECVVESQ